ncbi:hypothetical protein Pyn_15952 [Prunus yedoensis var. nudiflora]|uniref:Uncharacterized protein n=1 Tax=Prunus yedoensis var. nudiflora TaxID=2094558 RepID=A0A314XRX4_PRUYE|nr:hypothetical protein Pyn_15952 [Prunus yedoensis var. nudiflora]
MLIPTSPRELPISWGQSIGSMTIPIIPKVTNPLEVINWVYVDSNIIPSLPILLGDQLGPCRFSTSPRGYQFSGAINWVDADSLHHPEVTNSLGAINWVHINLYITLRLQIL